MRILHEDDNIKISIIERDLPSVTLCFSGAAANDQGVDIVGEEFIRASLTATAIFIVDKKISWANNIDFELLKNTIAPYIQNKIVNAIGNSMGGYNAIIASKYINITTVVSFVPQYSISHKVMPHESRWNCFGKNITNWRIESLDGHFMSYTQYYIIAGSTGGDRAHLEKMPTTDNIKKIYFVGIFYDHNIAPVLKRHNLLYDVINDCFANVNPTIIIQTKLSSPEYQAYCPVNAV